MTPIFSGDLRIVLLGRTGSGKSATGNTILNREAFKEDMCPDSITQECEKQETRKGRRLVSIIDTPGLQDTESETKVKDEIKKKCMEMSAPGPHVFLLVLRPEVRLTEEEKNTVKWIQKNFGKEAKSYTIILFTHADKLKGKPLKNLIEDSPDLLQLVISFGGRYHSFNNEDRENQDQVTELLEKIDVMVMRNEGKYYTDEMYKQVQERHPWCITAGVVLVVGVIAVLAVKRSKTSPE